MTYTPFTVGSRFRILPTDAPPSTDGRIDIWMPRGAFGSGEHETTATCIEALESMASVPGSRILDLGSGTGILSIAALKLGATRAVCVDIAADAVASAVRSCELNGVNDRVEHVCGTLSDVAARDFDLVLGNIYGDILLDNAEGLVERALPGAKLLLSGVLWEDNYNVRQRYERCGCEVVSNRMMETYSTILLVRG